MSEEKPIITPEAMGTWVAAAFIIALLGIVLAFYSMARSSYNSAAVQLEILALNKKIEQHIQQPGMPAPAMAPSGAEGQK